MKWASRSSSGRRRNRACGGPHCARTQGRRTIHPACHGCCHAIIEGPYAVTSAGNSASRRRLFRLHAEAAAEAPCAERFCPPWRRAFRRPVGESQTWRRRWRSTPKSAPRAGDSTPASRGPRAHPLRSLVPLPQEQDQRACGGRCASGERELDLANRLSFFMWSSIPDDDCSISPSPGGCERQACLAQSATHDRGSALRRA